MEYQLVELTGIFLSVPRMTTIREHHREMVHIIRSSKAAYFV